MSMQEYEYLRAELAELDELLAMTPEGAVIDRMSLESRRSEVAEELATYPTPSRWPVAARLTFNGKPVVDGKGIAIDFGGKAVSAFATVVASVGADQQGQLSERGPIPNRERFRLLITGTALGSFGFEIEENFHEEKVQTISPVSEIPPVEQAIERVKAILESSVTGGNVLADAIADTAPRALDDLRDFLNILANNQAICSISLKDDVFRFSDVGQVRQSLDRLGRDNIHEAEREILGSFIGYLPNSRQAEIWISETREVITCKVNLALGDPDAIDHILNRHVQLRIHTRQVGTGRPRYTILGYDLLPDHE